MLEVGSQPPGAAIAPERSGFGPEFLFRPFRGAKRTIIILSLALASCRGPLPAATPTPEAVSLRLLADSSTSPLLNDLATAYSPSNTVIAWNFQVGETDTILDWIKRGEARYALLDYVPVSLPEESWWTTPVGQDGLAIVVHPSNPVTGLTVQQFRMILQGRITNWQALGGADLPITVVARNDGSSAAALMQSMVLGTRQVTRVARLATTSQAVVDIVGTEPGAIGYVSMGYVTDHVRALALDGMVPTPANVTANQYPLRMPIVFAGLREPGNDAHRAFFAWVQGPEGQAIVRGHYGGLAQP